jgi:hypothetical protein
MIRGETSGLAPSPEGEGWGEGDLSGFRQP